MFHLKEYWKNIEIFWLTYLVYGYLIWNGYLKLVLCLLFILLMHELGHILGCLFCDRKISRIKVYPYGCMIALEDNFVDDYWQDIIITIAGPLMYIVIELILYIGNCYSIISNILYLYLKTANLNVFLMNIIPILPLDGGRIVKDVFCIIFKKYGEYISFLSSIILCFILYSYSNTWFKLLFISLIIIDFYEFCNSIKYNKYRKVLIDNHV